MSINSNIITKNLAVMSYGGDNIILPENEKSNLYMGIGLWSAENRLSEGLPVDVMQMLITAAIMRLRIMDANPGILPQIKILIADSMAVKEGADAGEVKSLVSVYKRSLKPLLELLNIHNVTTIVRASKLTSTQEYKAIKHELDTNAQLQQYADDAAHYRYIRTQTAITEYMHRHADVGVKVGWRKKGPAAWDESKFDAIYKSVCPHSRMSNLYAKAGLNMTINKKKATALSEGCPYTAYSKYHLQRYVVQPECNVDIKEVCAVTKAIKEHWLNAVTVCRDLGEDLGRDILPEDCCKGSNTLNWVYKALNYWVNKANQSTASAT